MSLETSRTGALYFTIGAAVLYAVLWVVTATTHTGSPTFDTIGAGLVVCMILGGVAMGLLYLVHRSRHI